MRHKKLTSLLLFTSLTFSTVGCSVDNFDANKKIESIKLVNTIEDEENGTTFEYTITFLDGTEYTFEVRNGKDGEQGIQGEPGKDGHTPEIKIGENGNWIIDGEDTGISAKGLDGEAGEDGKDGVSIVSIEKTSSEGLIDTYTITYSDNSTSTFTVVNGEQGEQGIQGEPGKDGHTPEIKIGENGNWIIDGVDIGIKAQGLNGSDGLDGKDGLSAYEIYVKYHPEYKGTEEEWIDDLVNDRLGEEAVAETHTITFNLNGGTYDGPTEIKVKHGEPILNLPIPKKYKDKNNELVFLGWYTGTTANDGQIGNYTPVLSDLNLVAAYSEYKVEYLDENDDTIITEWRLSDLEVRGLADLYQKRLVNDNYYLYQEKGAKRLFVDETLKPEFIVPKADIPSYIYNWEIVDSIEMYAGDIFYLTEPGIKIDVDLGLSEETSSVVFPDTIANLPIVDISISMTWDTNDSVSEITLNNSALRLEAYDVRTLQKIKLNENVKIVKLSGLQDLFEINLNNLPNLIEVQIRSCLSLSSLDFSNSTLLNVISLSDVENLSEVKFLNNNLNGLNIAGSHSLKYLDLANTKFIPNIKNGEISNSYLQLNLSELNELDISKISFDSSVNSLIINCPLLTSLEAPEAPLEGNKFAYLEFTEGINIKLKDIPYFKNAKIDCLILDSNQDSSVLNGLSLRTFRYNYQNTNSPLASITFENCAFYNYSTFGYTRAHYVNFKNCGNINFNSFFQGADPTESYSLEELHFEGNTALADIKNPVFINSRFPNLTDIYFNGTEEEWNNIEKAPSNVKLFDGSVTIHFEA